MFCYTTQQWYITTIPSIVVWLLGGCDNTEFVLDLVSTPGLAFVQFTPKAGVFLFATARPDLLYDYPAPYVMGIGIKLPELKAEHSASSGSRLRRPLLPNTPYCRCA
jgi:hypothetical protein